MERPGTSIFEGPLSAASHLGSRPWEYVAFTMPRYASGAGSDASLPRTLTSASDNNIAASRIDARVPCTASTFTSLNDAGARTGVGVATVVDGAEVFAPGLGDGDG